MHSRVLLILILTAVPFAAGIGGTETVRLSETGRIRIIVECLRNNEGTVRVALFDATSGFPHNIEDAYEVVYGTIENGYAEVVFEGVPYGSYAVAILHDENVNGKLDKKDRFWAEGVGFSNEDNVNRFNPDFDDAGFVLGDPDITLYVAAQYMEPPPVHKRPKTGGPGGFHGGITTDPGQ